ncbi:MAG: MaoC family dehydratase [Bacteroidota bacterium]
MSFETNEAYTTRLQSVDELEKYIGKELGLSPWLTITQERIDTFARVTDDEQWIHTDPERAQRESPYKTTIAHGFLVLSLASRFSSETFSIAGIKMGVNYGLDRVRFMNATPVGARLRGRVSLMSFEQKKPGVVRYKMKVVFEIEGEEKPACVAEFIAMAYA